MTLPYEQLLKKSVRRNRTRIITGPRNGEQTTTIFTKPFRICGRNSVIRCAYCTRVAQINLHHEWCHMKRFNWFTATIHSHQNKTGDWKGIRTNEKEYWRSWVHLNTPQISHVGKMFIPGVTKLILSDVNKWYYRKNRNNGQINTKLLW